MNGFETVLALSALLCSLVAGFVFAFATVVMPGIQRLKDREFLRAFQAMDGVIQRGQPLFQMVWAGSVVLLLTACVLGFWSLAGGAYLLLVAAATLYLFGVQLPTAAINIPLNNWLQKQDLDAATESAISDARAFFEARWVKWNAIRTICAALAAALLILLVLLL